MHNLYQLARILLHAIAVFALPLVIICLSVAGVVATYRTAQEQFYENAPGLEREYPYERIDQKRKNGSE